MIRLLFSLFILSMAFQSLEAQDYIEKKLKKSKLDQKWVELIATDNRIIKCFLVYPKDTVPTKSIILVHGEKGLTNTEKYYADQLAKKGFFVIAPSLLPERKPLIKNKEEGTEEKLYPGVKDYTVFTVNERDAVGELDFIFNFLKKTPLYNGSISLIGFSWGGYQTFNYAAQNLEADEFFIFYGNAPKVTYVYPLFARPIYGFYAAEDKAVTSMVKNTDMIMTANKRHFEYEIYPEATRYFMEKGLNPKAASANKKARKKAWKKMLGILK